MSKVKNPKSPWRASKRSTAYCQNCGKSAATCLCCLPEATPVAWWEQLADSRPAAWSRLDHDLRGAL